MKNKKTILIFSIFIVAAVSIMVLFIMKNESKSMILTSLYNTDNVLEKENYKKIVDISSKSKINDRKIENRIKNIYIKNDSNYKIDVKQYTNDTLINSNISYLEKKGNMHSYHYYIGNKIYEETIEKTDSILKFNVKYSSLKKILNNYNYIGTVNYNGKKLKKYSADANEFEIYNFLYSKKIFSKTTNNKTKLYLYIDSNTKVIYKMYFNIKNIKENNQNFEYKVSIDNMDIGNTKKINIPNNN